MFEVWLRYINNTTRYINDTTELCKTWHKLNTKYTTELYFSQRKHKIQVCCTTPVITLPCLQASLNSSASSLLNPSLLLGSSILFLFKLLCHSDLKKKIDYPNMGIKSQTIQNLKESETPT